LRSIMALNLPLRSIGIFVAGLIVGVVLIVLLALVGTIPGYSCGVRPAPLYQTDSSYPCWAEKEWLSASEVLAYSIPEINSAGFASWSDFPVEFREGQQMFGNSDFIPRNELTGEPLARMTFVCAAGDPLCSGPDAPIPITETESSSMLGPVRGGLFNRVVPAALSFCSLDGVDIRVCVASTFNSSMNTCKSECPFPPGGPAQVAMNLLLKKTLEDGKVHVRYGGFPEGASYTIADAIGNAPIDPGNVSFVYLESKNGIKLSDFSSSFSETQFGPIKKHYGISIAVCSREGSFKICIGSGPGLGARCAAECSA